MAKTYQPFPGVICQRLRNLVKLKKEAEAKREDIFTDRDAAEETLNGTPTGDTKEREHWQAAYGKCVLDLKRWNVTIKNIANQIEEMVEKADEPGLYDDSDVTIAEFEPKVTPKDDPDQATFADARPVGRRPKGPSGDAPVAEGENQHLAASILELGLPDHVAVTLKEQGFETVNHLVLHLNKGKKFIELHKLSEACAKGIEERLSAYLKKHNKAQVDKDLGRGDEPIRNQRPRGGPRVGRGAPVGKKDTGKGQSAKGSKAGTCNKCGRKEGPWANESKTLCEKCANKALE